MRRFAEDTTLLPTALLLTLVVLACTPNACQAKAQAQPIEADHLYQSGEQIVSVATGLTLTIPAGFAGEWDAESGALLLQSRTQTAGAIWGWSEGAVAEAAEAVGERLAQLGIQLEQRGEPQVSQDRIRGDFTAYTEDGPGLLVAEVRSDRSGGVVAVAALGSSQAEVESRSFVDAVVSSLRFTTPGAARWRGQLVGSVLSRSSAGSDMSTGGGATATGASQTTASLAICGDQYRYTESSETYFSIEGLSASNNSSDEHAGQWYLVADLIGNPTLYLESSDGRIYEWQVEEVENGVLIDGYLYQIDGGC